MRICRISIPGHRFDSETNLYYCGARYYDARTSRWISTDPILEMYLLGKPNGGVYNSININLYRYAANNPIMYNDPTGMLDRKTVAVDKVEDGVTQKNVVAGGKVKEGDTLWSIAKQELEATGQNTSDSNIANTVDVIKKVNGLKSDTIHPGQKLITGFYGIGGSEIGNDNVYPELWIVGGLKTGQYAYKGGKFLVNAGKNYILKGGLVRSTITLAVISHVGKRNISYMLYAAKESVVQTSNLLLSNPVTVNNVLIGISDAIAPGWPNDSTIYTKSGAFGYGAGTVIKDLFFED